MKLMHYMLSNDIQVYAQPQKSSFYMIADSYWPTNCYNFTGIKDLHKICGPPCMSLLIVINC